MFKLHDIEDAINIRLKELENSLSKDLKNIEDAVDNGLKESKWKFYYDYARKGLDEDIARFQLIDDKAFKLLSFVSIIIALFSGASAWEFQNIEFKYTLYNTILIVSTLVTFTTLCASWGLLFRAVKITKVPRMPLHDGLTEFIKSNNLANIYLGLTKECIKGQNVNKKIIDVKGDYISRAYFEIAWSACMLVICVFLIVLNKSL